MSPTKLRYAFHRYRNYLYYADHRGYRDVVRRLRSRGTGPLAAEKSVLFDFTDPLIDKDRGRYAFNLVREFIDAGFAVYLARNFWYLSSFHRKAHKQLLLDEPVWLFEGRAGEPQLSLLITDRDDSPYRGDCKRGIILDCRSRLHRQKGLALVPYRQHPYFSTGKGLPPWPDLDDDERPVPVSFFGHWLHRDYDNTEGLAEFGVHGRRELIQGLVDGLGADEQCVVSGGWQPEAAGKFVLGDDDRLPDRREYARWLRRSNFFVCAPGTGYPMCHNLAESMLLGCLPIVQRPELTGFPLVDGESCFAFADPPALLEVVRRCLVLPEECVRTMRAALRVVVRDCVEPGSFARELDLEGDLPESLALLWFERSA